MSEWIYFLIFGAIFGWIGSLIKGMAGAVIVFFILGNCL